MVELILPWPPSVNHYWGKSGHRVFISKKGNDFRQEVTCKAIGLDGYFSPLARLHMEIYAFPPDKRKRDLDNILKSLLDALQHAGLYEDDNQIDDLHIIRCTPAIGEVLIKVSEIKKELHHQ